MRRHIAALYTHDAEGRMLAVNEPGGAPAPRVFLGRTPEGNEWRVRHDLPDDLAEALDAVCRLEPVTPNLEVPARGASELERLLAAHAPVERVWRGPAYRFPRAPAYRFPDGFPGGTEAVRITPEHAGVLLPHFEDWVEDVDAGRPFFAVLENGRAVSICTSVRVTPEAHEAGVETAPEFRGGGLAGRVVAAWAGAVADLGAQPLYSTSWENAASRAVAAGLGLACYGADLHIT